MNKFHGQNVQHVPAHIDLFLLWETNLAEWGNEEEENSTDNRQSITQSQKTIFPTYLFEIRILYWVVA
jgi:hypothetical protein